MFLKVLSIIQLIILVYLFVKVRYLTKKVEQQDLEHNEMLVRLKELKKIH